MKNIQPRENAAPVILFFGPPGAGKGTQARLLVNAYACVHVTTGGLIRRKIQTDAAFRKSYGKDMAEGRLLDDNRTMHIVHDALKTIPRSSVILFDGVPRNMRQVRLLEHLLKEEGRAIAAAVYVHATRKEALERMTGRIECTSCGSDYHTKFRPPKRKTRCDKCGGSLQRRTEDEPKAALERLRIYRILTLPIVAHYRKKRAVIELKDNGQGIAHLHRTLVNELHARGILRR